MPLIPIVVSPFPNVPNLPGVPQLARSSLAPPSASPTLGTPATNNTLWQAAQTAPKWGVFDSSGTQVIVPDSHIDFDNRNEWRVSTYPIQSGGFASYNKVIVPAEYTLRMTKGGTLASRTAFLAQVAAVASSLNLYTILTPEQSYLNCNVTRYEVTRKGVEGAYFLAEVDIFFTTINAITAQYSTANAQTANASVPTAIPQVNQGLVQPFVPGPSVISAINASYLKGAP
jgi:hypothetical protein